MTLGEKIQVCRKSKGLSQDEIAFVLGVSRQALSKWECNTSTPDIDKIIALSNYFNVTTDYLLKDGYEDKNADVSIEANKERGNIPIAISTAIITIGLITSLAMANDGTKFSYWQFGAAALGIGIQIIGICIFEIIYFSKYCVRKQYLFWSINTWQLSVMPIIFMSGVLSRLLNRFDVFRYSFSIMLFYLAFNGALTLTFLILTKRLYKANEKNH